MIMIIMIIMASLTDKKQTVSQLLLNHQEHHVLSLSSSLQVIVSGFPFHAFLSLSSVLTYFAVVRRLWQKIYTLYYVSFISTQIKGNIISIIEDHTPISNTSFGKQFLCCLVISTAGLLKPTRLSYNNRNKLLIIIILLIVMKMMTDNDDDVDDVKMILKRRPRKKQTEKKRENCNVSQTWKYLVTDQSTSLMYSIIMPIFFLFFPVIWLRLLHCLSMEKWVVLCVCGCSQVVFYDLFSRDITLLLFFTLHFSSQRQ